MMYIYLEYLRTHEPMQATTTTVATYNIYQRQTFSAPTAVRPVALKRSSGGSGTFQGIQEMSDAEIKYTFGQRAKTRIMSGTKNVGTYILNSSATGAQVSQVHGLQKELQRIPDILPQIPIIRKTLLELLKQHLRVHLKLILLVHLLEKETLHKTLHKHSRVILLVHLKLILQTILELLLLLLYMERLVFLLETLLKQLYW